MTKGKSHVVAWLYLLPSLALYSFFVIYPVGSAFYLSLTEWKGIAAIAPTFIGLDNYVWMLQSQDFWRALRNSGWLMMASFVVQLPLSFGLALLITSRMRGVRLFKAAFFMPVVLPVAAVGLMWSAILYPNGGTVNVLLHHAGLDTLASNWLGDPRLAIFSIALVSCWIYAGFNMLIFAAGLSAIPEEIYEAGTMDGAEGWKKLAYITIPNVIESLKIYMILAIIGSFKVFDLIFVLTRGGPNGASEVPAMMLYNRSFVYEHFGGGSAIGIFILVVGLLAAVFFNQLFKPNHS